MKKSHRGNGERVKCRARSEVVSNHGEMDGGSHFLILFRMGDVVVEECG